MRAGGVGGARVLPRARARGARGGLSDLRDQAAEIAKSRGDTPPRAPRFLKYPSARWVT